jgi:predicted transcriptional regulator
MISKNLENLLKESILPSRLRILRALRDGEVNISDLQRTLKNNKDMPLSTIYRSINSLVDAGVLKKEEGVLSLTPIGYIIVDAVDCIDNLVYFEYLDLAADFLSSLPSELRFGIKYLGICEKVDITTFSSFSFQALESVRYGGKYIDRIVDKELYKVMIEKRLNGATEKVISPEEILMPKIETEIAALKELGLSKDKIREVWERVDIKVLKAPVQMGVLDRRIGAMMLIKGRLFSPFFVTTEKEAVRWMENVFEYYWDIAEPIGNYIEGGIEGIRKIILERV